jgi:hypothetical protein
MDAIENIIIEQVSKITEHENFNGWLSEQKKLAQGALIVINNSFVFRDTKSNKSTRYVALQIDKNKNPVLPPVIYTHTGTRINADFRYVVPNPAEQSWVSMDAALSDEKVNLGELVFVLLAEIRDSIDIKPIKNPDFREIAWDPALGDEIRVYDNSIEVGRIHDEEAIWQSVEKHFQENGKEIPPDLKEALSDAIEQLHEDAIADLNLPETGQELRESITDQIVAVLKEQMVQYEKAVTRLIEVPEDNSELNEVLRLAYNFATDAAGYLKLIISVCDLKPVVLWGTLSYHYKLSEVFRSLPFTRSSTKPALELYKDTIGDARNSAFHHLFPFKKALNIRFRGKGLEGAELHIFSEHRKKKQNDLYYTDKPLADVLIQFTRARERRITNRFWRQNLEVMKHTVELFDATAAFLKHLHANR